MTAALWYLLSSSVRNRLRRQAARLRNPRYALAFIAGLAYFWMVFLRPRGLSGDVDLSRSPVVAVFFSIFGITLIAYSWIFGADRTSLAFTQAEVAMLFPAPVSRRALILYKLARSQLMILVSTAIWVVLLGRGSGSVPSPLRAIAVWSLFSTFTLHRLGIALLRSGVTEFGPRSSRRSLPAMLAFGAILAAVGAGLWLARADFGAAADASALGSAVLAALQRAPASIALLPFTLVIAPFVATNSAEWASAIGPALLILVLHVIWVVRSDASFEEAAAEASARQAKRITEIRARRGGISPVRAKSAKRTLPLRPTGAPAVAILWKNILWLLRTGQVRSLLLPAGLMVVAALILKRTEGPTGTVIAGIAGMFMAMLLFFGPMFLRNDLRSDLLNLPLLRTLPLRGRDLVLAEILSGATANAIAQTLLLIVAVFSIGMGESKLTVPVEARVALLVGAPALLLALNGVLFTLHNGAALLFPGWVRLGERGPSGFEATGQMMITSVATLLSLAVLLILPAIGGAIAFFLLSAQLGSAVLVACTVAAALLAGEVHLMVLGLGRAFDRVEPIQMV